MCAAAVIGGEVSGPFASVIRLAGLNALSVPLLEGGRYCADTSGDLSGIPSLFANRRVCMVGAIIPLLKRLKELGVAEGGGGYRLFRSCVRKINLLNVERLRQLGLYKTS